MQTHSISPENASLHPPKRQRLHSSPALSSHPHQTAQSLKPSSDPQILDDLYIPDSEDEEDYDLSLEIAIPDDQLASFSISQPDKPEFEAPKPPPVPTPFAGAYAEARSLDDDEEEEAEYREASLDLPGSQEVEMDDTGQLEEFDDSAPVSPPREGSQTSLHDPSGPDDGQSIPDRSPIKGGVGLEDFEHDSDAVVPRALSQAEVGGNLDDDEYGDDIWDSFDDSKWDDIAALTEPHPDRPPSSSHDAQTGTSAQAIPLPAPLPPAASVDMGSAWAGDRPCAEIFPNALAKAKRLPEAEEAPQAESSKAASKQPAHSPSRIDKPSIGFTPPRSHVASSSSLDATRSDVFGGPDDGPPPFAMGGFQTGGGKKIAQPSDAARAKAAALFLDPEQTTSTSFGRPETPIAGGFQSAAGKPLAPVSEATKLRMAAFFADLEPDTPLAAKDAPDPLLLQATTLLGDIPNDEASASSIQSAPLHPPQPISKPFESPLKRPLGPSGPPNAFVTPMRPPSGGFRAASKLSTQIQPMSTNTDLPTSQMGTPKRINLGMTPQRNKGAASKLKFSTPFKAGVRPQGVSAYASPSFSAASPRVANTPARVVKAKEQFTSVFNLAPRVGRVELQDDGALPQEYSVDRLIARKIPTEVIFMTAKKSTSWSFETASGPFGALHALQGLLDAGCRPSTATPLWVENHWGMVVWKAAAMVRWKPELLRQFWTPGAIVNQLKYRYEREHNLAHRSAIKRIQEQDAAANASMCLVLYAVLESNAPAEGEPEPESILDRGNITGIELSDGWYRIRAEIDLSLKRAIRAGKIQVGDKLAISGARLEGSGEGIEVLKALNESKLKLGANCTAKAPWHEKLGFRGRPWIASLRSLIGTGGLVPLVDVVVTKMFPAGFVDAVAPREAPWDLEEEDRRQEAWTAKRAVEFDKLVNRLDALARNLRRAAATRASETVHDSDFNAEGAFEDILDVEDQVERIKEFSRGQLSELGKVADQRLEQVQNGSQSMEEALDDIVPRRKIRQFRVVRILDTQFFRRATKRSAQLTIWDVDSVEEGMIKENQRYWITNLNPLQVSSWRKPEDDAEIMLGTRRDTKWQRLAEV